MQTVEDDVIGLEAELDDWQYQCLFGRGLEQVSLSASEAFK